ncbi:hypothetical protein RBH29_17735 [Herbivorax sp. ANBcel31]|uniref:hypothetical protein n=1 Tax=Herbivorax sp. ANBcel31 TaxID=3069754 RepID=UPI0027B77F9B|nr:hypothetical protein [Herbivorax sp. ANBcel31]MDQ2088268.1 hypothetical protein [Herbivorax sp. ANBcel31]
MRSLKQTVMDLISNLPDTAKIDEIMYKLYVADKVMKGENDIDQGNFISVEQLRKETGEW